MNHGVLPDEEAAKIYKKVMNRKKNKGSVLSPATKQAPAKKRSKVKVDRGVTVEADFNIGGAERVGSTTML